MSIPDITRETVLSALQEFEATGRSAFLKKYGFGRSRGYYIVRDGKEYDSKAVVGAAHGFIGPQYQPLRAEDFSGGEQQVARVVRRLGFEMKTPKEAVSGRVVPFVIGRIYHRQRHIHEVFGGQERGGICTPADAPFVFLFTGESGTQYGYQDGPMDDGSFAYSGEGQLGDQQFVRGNSAIRQHAAEGRDLLLLEANPTKKGLYRYLGCYAFADYEYRTEPDRAENLRQVIVFRLVPVNVVEAAGVEEQPTGETIDDLDELRRRAYQAILNFEADGSQGGTRTYYQRSAAVKEYVLRRANGVCECCGNQAPFARSDGSPYLEPHHIRRVSDGGPDHPQWVGAVCPNCHRQIHHGADGASVNDRLQTHVKQLESR